MTKEDELERRVSRLENIAGDISAQVAMVAIRADAMHRAWKDYNRGLVYVWIVAAFGALAGSTCLGVLWK